MIFRFDTSKLRKSPDNNVMLPIELAQGSKLRHNYYESITIIIYLVCVVYCNGYHMYESQLNILVVTCCFLCYLSLYD